MSEIRDKITAEALTAANDRIRLLEGEKAALEQERDQYGRRNTG